MKKLLAVMVFAVLAALTVAAAPARQQVEDEVRTRKLVLVDAAGKVRATFDASAGPQDATLLVFRTPGGEGRIHIGLMASGDAMVTLDDAKGARVLMSLMGQGSSVIVYDGQGKPVHQMSAVR